MSELDTTELQVLIGDIVSPTAAQHIAVWDRTSVHKNEKDKLLVQMSKMRRETDLEMMAGEEVGWQIHAFA